MARTSNLQQFTLGIDRFVAKAENTRKMWVKAVAMEGLRGLVVGTRVDKGRARGNWQAGEIRPPEGHKPERGQIGGRADPDIMERVDALLLGSRQILNMSGDRIIWIHNGVPYIGVLERKDKMLAGTVERLRTWIRST